MSTQLTQAYLQNKVNDLEAAEQVPEDELEDDEDGTPKGYRGLILHAVIIIVLVMIGMYSLAIVVFSGGVLMLAGSIALGTGVAVVHSEYRLSKLESKYASIVFLVELSCVGFCNLNLLHFLPTAFRTVHNKLRKDVNIFAGQNVKLTKANDELNLQVFVLKENEQRFQELCEKQNSNVKYLVKMVDENQKVIDKKKKLIHEDIVESLINAAFEGERSEDGVFSDREINRLLQRMRGLPAVKVNEDMLKLSVSKDRSVLSLIALIRDLDVEGDQLGDKMFIIDDMDPRLLESLRNQE
jgi:hypothetical protein